MPRFALHQFATPDYANFIPDEDKEERPVQKIEKFATFLNEIPWFPKSEDEYEDTYRSPEDEQEADNYAKGLNAERAEDPDGLTKTERSERESKRMEGYRPTEDVTPERVTESPHELGNKTPEELQAMAVEDPEGFLDLQRMLKELYGIKVDGIYGPKTQGAYDKWNESTKYGEAQRLYERDPYYTTPRSEGKSTDFDSALDEAKKKRKTDTGATSVKGVYKGMYRGSMHG